MAGDESFPDLAPDERGLVAGHGVGGADRFSDALDARLLPLPG